LMRSQRFTGVKYEGKVFDCGSKIGFLAANVAFALEREDIASDFLTALEELGVRQSGVVR
jgi:UTP--glucose-1-phosphate uridylyltransferase